MNLVGSGGDDPSDDPISADPIPDVRELLAEVTAAGLDPRRDAFVSFHLRFDDRSSWERASAAAAESWDVSAYSRPDAHMLRLSRATPLTEQAVEEHRAAIIVFAADHDATWESVAVEDLAPASTWKLIAAQRAGTHDDVEQVVELPSEPVAQDGTGGEVA